MTARRSIPRYKRFVEESPLIVTGKPQKFKMHGAMVDLLRAA